MIYHWRGQLTHLAQAQLTVDAENEGEAKAKMLAMLTPEMLAVWTEA
jgi:hypothetical protein